MLGVRVPQPLWDEVFAGREFRQVAHNRRQAVMAQAGESLPSRNFGAQAQEGVAVFRVVKGVQ